MSWLLYLAAVPTAIVMLLRVLSLVLPPGPAQLVSFIAFTITAFGLMIACASYGVVAGILFRLVGYGGLVQWTVGRAFKWSMWLTTGVSFQVTGSMKREGGMTGEDALTLRPAVFVGNHQTEMDVLMLGTFFPKWTSVTAKSSLKWTPFLGWFMTLSKTVFIDRANRAMSRATFDTAAETMVSERQNVFIFPEGTRSYAEEPTLLPFKKGAFHLAVQAQVPIVPVVCANYENVLNVKKKKFRPGTIDITVLPPISTRGCTADDVNRLVEKTQKAMLEELIRLSHVTDNGKNGMPLPSASGVDDVTRELRKRH
ncbi:hypothetical protein BDU57DRAFT_593306 [Ampelomyces quisqualis]|uniref:1-acyl-sn-glycerol-3-phosphate acyltransferase n=1 Tax=Ampelomyces quisqualis TaxID=50730 RepID=A0A6A5QWY6_AMPQU|nr:hypothetical protein BDU57DRAFT_593306 [Ampelomyces quisqualis]